MVEKAFDESCKEASCMKERLQLNIPRREYLEKSEEDTLGDQEGEIKMEKGNVHQRIEELCKKIEEKEDIVKKKRDELHNLEIEAEVEVFEMKQEIVSLQAKLDDVG